MSWQLGIEHLKSIAQLSGFQSDARALAELIQVDIDRRYGVGESLPLADYFHAFPSLFSDAEALAAIAFEDFRARRSAQLDCPRSRWSWVPGVAGQAWFSDLSEPQHVNEVLREPVLGRDFGEFRLVSLLGEGAFSKVYLATQRQLGYRYVALKVVRRALSEPYHLARLHHTGIVPLFSLHRIGEYSALCMPYSGAATLADWLQATHPADGRATNKSLRTGQSLIDTVQSTQARLVAQTLHDQPQHSTGESLNVSPSKDHKHLARSHHSMRPLELLATMRGPELTLWLACRLAAALAHAHARGIAHGDLKPANILLRNDGEPSLIDFNLARAEDTQDQHWIGGTLPYMAPEQMRAIIGRNCLLTFSSDVYSFGMILYEILEGHLPYAAPVSMAEVDLDRAIVARQATLQFSGNPALAGMQAILRRCLAFEPGDRYADGEQLLEDLESERQHLPLKHAQELVTRRIRKLAKRHPVAISNSAFAGLAATLTLVALLFGWFCWLRWQAAVAYDTVAGLIQNAEDEHHRILDMPAEAALTHVHGWFQDTREKLGGDTQPLARSAIVTRLPKGDRDGLLTFVLIAMFC